MSVALPSQSAGRPQPVDNQGVIGKCVTVPLGGGSAFERVLQKEAWERAASLTPSEWETDVNAICQRDLAELTAYALEDVRGDSVKTRIARTILATDTEAFMEALPRLGIESREQRLDLAHRYMLKTQNSDALPALGIESEEDKKALFDLFYKGHLATSLKALENLDIKDQPWLREQGYEMIKSDLFGLGMLIRNVPQIKKFMAICGVHTDNHQIDFGRAVLAKNPWALPVFMTAMEFKSPLKQIQLAMDWVEKINSLYSPNFKSIDADQHHEVRKPVEAFLTKDQGVNLAFLETYSTTLPKHFAHNAFDIFDAKNEDLARCLVKAIQSDPTAIYHLELSDFESLDPKMQDTVHKALLGKSPSIATDWKQKLEKHQALKKAELNAGA